MRVLSLFDGMSVGQLALERAGIQVDTYYASEIDKAAIKVTQKNFPNTIQLGNVQEIDIPKDIDLLIGGSPCQGFSYAGKQLNFDDPRSRLFFDFVRILRETKPRYFLLENTPMKQEFQDVISEYLGVEPVLINSQSVSAQSRKRLYWTNIQDFLLEEKTVSLRSILENVVDEKYYIAYQTAIAVCEEEVASGKVGYLGSNKHEHPTYIIHGEEVVVTPHLQEDTSYCFPCLTPHRVKKRQNGQRFKPNGAKFYTLTAQDKHGVLLNGRLRHLTPLECERLQTLPDDYTYIEGISDSNRYKMLGNGWTADVIASIFKGING